MFVSFTWRTWELSNWPQQQPIISHPDRKCAMDFAVSLSWVSGFMWKTIFNEFVPCSDDLTFVRLITLYAPVNFIVLYYGLYIVYDVLVMSYIVWTGRINARLNITEYKWKYVLSWRKPGTTWAPGNKDDWISYLSNMQPHQEPHIKCYTVPSITIVDCSLASVMNHRLRKREDWTRIFSSFILRPISAQFTTMTVVHFPGT
jgi:hypothetical protein